MSMIIISQPELLNTANFALKYAQRGVFRTATLLNGKACCINVMSASGMARLVGDGGKSTALCEAAPFAPYKINIASLSKWLLKFPKTAQFDVSASEEGLGFKSGTSTLLLAAQGEALEFLEAVQVQGKAFTVPGAEMRRALKIVAHAQGREEARDYLNGVNFQVRDGRLWLCATDGQRLALTPLALPENAPGTLNATLATATVNAILKLPVKQAVTLTFDVEAERVLVNDDVFELTGGTYPDYLRVIPGGDPAATLTVDRDSLSGTVRLAVSVSADKTKAVMFDAPGGAVLTVASADSWGDEGLQTVPLAGSTGEMPFSKYNSKYFLDMLEVLKAKTVVLEIHKYGETSVLCVKDGETTHVLADMNPLRSARQQENQT